MTKKKFKQYCSNCGGYLIRIPVRADKILIPYYYGTLQLGARYNQITGYEQYGIIVQCENKKWYNNCDKWVDEDSLHDVKF